MKDARPILLVEDDRVDAMTVKRAFVDTGIENELVTQINGEEALAYLKSPCNKKPCLILLDLSMPKMDGLEFLRTVKSDEELRKIPIIVLTTSNEKSDIVKSFELGAAGYMLKSIGYNEFVNKIRAIDRYWSFSELPECKMSIARSRI